MLTSSSCSPVERSTPVIMAPSMSFLSSVASAFLRRSATISSTILFMKATAPALLHPQVLHRETADHHDGLERAHQRFDEGMIIAPVERIEMIVESAEANGVERQRGHVVDDVDLLVAVQPLPLLYELFGDIDHARVIGLHGAVAE